MRTRGQTRLADGGLLAWQQQGPPDAPPLLLLAGQANSSRWWDRLRGDLSAARRTVGVDYRGTGDSPLGPASATWSTASFADDVVGVLDDLGLAQVDVYGTSMGGRVAQVLAAAHPARVRRLVLACTSPGGPLAQERSPGLRRSLSDPDPARQRQALLDLMYTPAWAAAHGAGSTLLGDPALTPEAARRHLRVSGRHDAWDALPAIAAPTLVLHGSDDLMTPVANAVLLTDRIPGAQLSITAGGRHGFFEEHAPTVTPQVLAFLR